MHKLERDRRRVLQDQGLYLRCVEHRGKHVAYVCEEGTLFASKTPSDRREMVNFRALARRIARL